MWYNKEVHRTWSSPTPGLYRTCAFSAKRVISLSINDVFKNKGKKPINICTGICNFLQNDISNFFLNYWNKTWISHTHQCNIDIVYYIILCRYRYSLLKSIEIKRFILFYKRFENPMKIRRILPFIDKIQNMLMYNGYLNASKNILCELSDVFTETCHTCM